MFHLSGWPHSFPDTEVTNDPAEHKTSSQVPADTSHLPNSSRQPKDSPPVCRKKTASTSIFLTQDSFNPISTYCQNSLTEDVAFSLMWPQNEPFWWLSMQFSCRGRIKRNKLGQLETFRMCYYVEIKTDLNEKWSILLLLFFLLQYTLYIPYI